MTIEEARSKIREVTSAARSFQSLLMSIKSSIEPISTSAKSINLSILKGIKVAPLRDYSIKTSNEVSNKINECLNIIDAAYSKVMEDAEIRIAEIVADYNNSLGKDSKQPRLEIGGFND